MLPGVLAGWYPVERMGIDLVRLCASAGARLIVGNFAGLDVNEQRLLFDDRPSLPFDILSIGIGSVPSRDGVEVDDTVVEIKPMQTFLSRLESRIQKIAHSDRVDVLRVVVVGAGVGGVEITLCLPRRLEKLLNNIPLDLTLVSATKGLADGTTRKTQERLRQQFASRGIHVRFGKRVKKVVEGTVILEDGDQLAADIVL